MDRGSDGPGRRLARVAAARVEGGPAWRLVWPAAVAFVFFTQVVTGLAIWMYYSPGAERLGKRLLPAISRPSGLAAAGGPSLRGPSDAGVGGRLARRDDLPPGLPRTAGSALLDRRADGAGHAGLEPYRRPLALGPEQLLGHAGPHRVSAAAAAGRPAALRAGGGRPGFRPPDAHPLYGLARGGLLHRLWAFAVAEWKAGAAARGGQQRGQAPFPARRPKNGPVPRWWPTGRGRRCATPWRARWSWR